MEWPVFLWKNSMIDMGRLRVGNAYRVYIPADVCESEKDRLNIKRGGYLVVHILAYVEDMVVLRYWSREKNVWLYSVEPPEAFEKVEWISKVAKIEKATHSKMGFGPQGLRDTYEWRILRVIWKKYKSGERPKLIAEFLNACGHRDKRSKSETKFWTDQRIRILVMHINSDCAYASIKNCTHVQNGEKHSF